MREKIIVRCCECHKPMQVFFLSKDYSSVVCDDCINDYQELWEHNKPNWGYYETV